MANFDVFLPILLKHEGGYSNHPQDPGGETNMGITMATFRTCAQRLLGIEPTSVNLKALTTDQAGVIYRELYWNRIQGDVYTSQHVANMVCDFCVNAGGNAIRVLQRVLKGMGADYLTVDGVMGRETLTALHCFDQGRVHNAYKRARIEYYNTLGVHKPMFLKGWLNRVHSFNDVSEDA